LVKHHISSTQLSQPPLLLFPVALLAKLDEKLLKPMERNELSTKELNEFKKTARVIEGLIRIL
jgi:hypothetical protein